MTQTAPEIIELTPQWMEELLERAASGTLREEDMELMRHIFASYAGLSGLFAAAPFSFPSPSLTSVGPGR